MKNSARGKGKLNLPRDFFFGGFFLSGLFGDSLRFWRFSRFPVLGADSIIPLSGCSLLLSLCSRGRSDQLLPQTSLPCQTHREEREKGTERQFPSSAQQLQFAIPPGDGSSKISPTMPRDLAELLAVLCHSLFAVFPHILVPMAGMTFAQHDSCCQFLPGAGCRSLFWGWR